MGYHRLKLDLRYNLLMEMIVKKSQVFRIKDLSTKSKKGERRQIVRAHTCTQHTCTVSVLSDEKTRVES